MFDPTAAWDEKRVMERFSDELLPAIKRYGPMIGERAMQGDREAEAIILRYNAFAAWVDPWNFRDLGTKLKNWIAKNAH